MSLDDDTDEAFVHYCQIHSETDRALFNGRHINRLFALAGRRPPCAETQFASMDRWTVADLVDDINAIRPPCLQTNAPTNGTLGANLARLQQQRIRAQYGWNYG